MNAPCPASRRNVIREFIIAAPLDLSPREARGELLRRVRREAAPIAHALRERKDTAAVPPILEAEKAPAIGSAQAIRPHLGFVLYLNRNDLVFGRAFVVRTYEFGYEFRSQVWA